jgi:putative peptidoglycan lipid II flippase
VWPESLEFPAGAAGQISRAALTVAIFSALAMFVSMGKEVLVASRFGRIDALDALLMAFLVPFVVVRVVAGSFDSALIPALVRLRERDSAEIAQRLFSNATVISLTLLVVTALMLGILGRYYLPYIASGFGAEKLALATRLHGLFSVYLVFAGISLVWAGALNARERFAVTAFAPLVTPIVIVIFILAFGPRLGIWALASGIVAGALFEVVLLGHALIRAGLSPWPRWHGLDENIRQVTGHYASMVGAAILMNAILILERSAAASLGGGSVAALNYGHKVVAAVCSLLGMALYTSVLPYFSQMVARESWQEYRRTLMVCLVVTLAVTVPAAFGLIIFSRPIIEILFERGVFSSADTQVVTGVQIFYAFQIPFFVLAVPLMRALSSLGRNGVLMWGGGVALASGMVLYRPLSRLLGTPGVALGTSLVSFILCVFLAVVVLRVLPRGASENEREQR